MPGTKIRGTRTFDGDAKFRGSASFVGSVEGSAIVDSNGNFWHETHVAPRTAAPGGSGPTEDEDGACYSWILDATGEYLYWGTNIHQGWDESTDIVVQVALALTTAEAADSTIDTTLLTDYHGNHDVTNARTQTRIVAHDIESFNAQDTVHILTFVIDHDKEDHEVRTGDFLCCRFNLNSVASVSSVRFLTADILYRTKSVNIPYSSSPTEG